jgi:hypothetical protein
MLLRRGLRLHQVICNCRAPAAQRWCSPRRGRCGGGRAVACTSRSVPWASAQPPAHHAAVVQAARCCATSASRGGSSTLAAAAQSDGTIASAEDTLDTPFAFRVALQQLGGKVRDAVAPALSFCCACLPAFAAWCLRTNGCCGPRPTNSEDSVYNIRSRRHQPLCSNPCALL